MEKKNFLTEYLELVYLISFIVSVLISFFFFNDLKNYVLILAVLLLIYFVVVMLWLVKQSRLEKTRKTENNYNQDRFANFWKNNLSPNEKEEELKLIPKIVIIDHASNSEKIFKDIHDNQKLLSEGNQLINNLDTVFSKEYVLVRRWECKDDEDYEKTNLKQQLKNANGVIFSRTKWIEKDWFYEILNDWAKEHSEFPCLYINKLSEKDKKDLEKRGKLSKIPPYFNKIEDEIGHLPWKFLIKANQRSANWRKQAAYNRFVGLLFFASFIISLILFLISGIILIIQYNTNQNNTNQNQEIEISQKERDKMVFDLIENPRNKLSEVIQNKQNEYYSGLEKMYENKEKEYDKKEIKKLWKEIVKITRSEYLNSYTDISNISDLHVSYWVRSDKFIQAFVTTESGKLWDRWDYNKLSASGCSFMLANSHAQWDEQNDITVFDFKGNNLGKQGCSIGDRPPKPIQSIICTSINNLPNSPEKYTVGICAFAVNKAVNPRKANIFLNDYRGFLRQQTQRFNDIIQPLIESNKITPLITNEKGEIEPIKVYE